jgi:hypothetical protein
MDPMPTDGWIECPAGQLDELVGRLQERVARQLPIKRMNVVAVLFASTVLLAILIMGGMMAARALASSGALPARFYVSGDDPNNVCPALATHRAH